MRNNHHGFDMAVGIEQTSVEEASVGKVIKFILAEMKPRGKWRTPFNLISIPVMILGAALLVIRFAKGLGAITNLSQDFPWGLWI